MEGKTVKSARRKYDAEFKQEVLKLVESGRPAAEIARSLGIRTSLIYYWKKISQKNGSAGAAMGYDHEKASLQRRIKEVEQERDILKKALGIFSR